MSDIIDRGAALLQEIRDLVDASEIANKVIVTDDARKIDTTSNLRAGVIVVHPAPSIEWPSMGVQVVTWEITIVTSPDQSPAEIWGRLDELVQVIRPAILTPNAKAVPGERPRPEPAPAVPGYTITFPEHLED